MRSGAPYRILAALVLTSSWGEVPAFGNDGAASVAVGGIQLKREARISMEKERLTITTKKVTLEYEFLNPTDQDITTEIAFPVPPYDEFYEDASSPKRLDDFRVWVDGQETKYQTETKAMLNGLDYTALLQKLGVDVASLGHFDYTSRPDPHSPDVERLPAAQRDELKRLGLIRDNGFMGWTVVKTYYWPQTFPARQVLHVRHEYAPVLGFEQLQIEETFPTPRQERTKEFQAAIRDSCMDPSLQQTLVGAARKQPKEWSSYIPSEWVDYVLTTANTWKTPIKEFELLVERPSEKPPLPGQWFVSFCWDGSVTQLDADHFSARMINFVPKRELHVSFFGIH